MLVAGAAGLGAAGFRIVMTMFEATYRDDLKQPWQLDDQLCGNLCRCTGYQGIMKAIDQICEDALHG